LETIVNLHIEKLPEGLYLAASPLPPVQDAFDHPLIVNTRRAGSLENRRYV
jgi:hypothetical protein